MLINTHFVLASSSRSRYYVLRKAGLNFTAKKPLCDEDKIKKKLKKNKNKPKEIAKRLAEEKAKSISKKLLNKLVIGCDTIILFDEKVIDKVKTLSLAKQKLKKLSGKEHKIITAICAYKKNKKIWSKLQTTKVKIRKLNKKNIDQYLKKSGEQILTSVGCYQIEKSGPQIIEFIKGDYFNVMGLPLFPLINFIKSYK